MKIHKKTFLGSIIIFFVGTSCCWLSTLAIWIGGVAFIGTITSFIENTQVLLISIGAILLILSIVLFIRNKRKSSNKF